MPSKADDNCCTCGNSKTVSVPSATNRLPDSRDGITITGSGGPTGVAIRQTTVCSCIPPVTDKSIAKRWTEHHRVLQGALERLELLEGKLSRAVLRGLGGSNPARLPGGDSDIISLPNHLPVG